MAKRYDNDFDAAAFVDNFRATEDPPSSPEQNQTEKTVEQPKPRQAKPKSTTSMDDYKRKFIEPLTYKNPRFRFPAVGIHPDFMKRLMQIKLASDRWGISVSTYLNNVLEQHFRDYDKTIDEYVTDNNSE